MNISEDKNIINILILLAISDDELHKKREILFKIILMKKVFL